jgi:hypothetical protein
MNQATRIMLEEWELKEEAVAKLDAELEELEELHAAGALTVRPHHHTGGSVVGWTTWCTIISSCRFLRCLHLEVFIMILIPHARP